MRLSIQSLALSSVGLLLTAGAHAQEASLQSLDEIRSAAITALGADPAQAEPSVANVRLAACSQPLQAVASGPRTALVRCPDTPGWKLYVPVKVHQAADVVVLRTPARAGVPITAEQLQVQRRDVAEAAGLPIVDPAAVIGRSPARALPAGAPLTAADLSEGTPLKRGDPVVIVARIEGIEVRMAGRALGTATIGGTVTVENVESHQIVRGRLAAPGVVEVQ